VAFFMPKGIKPEQQGANLNQQRGNVWVDNGYQSDVAPSVLPTGKPNPMLLVNYRDQYARVFPDGPYDRTWQGVQKNNPIACLSIGKQVMPNPLQRNRMRVTHVNKTNFTSHSIGAGTALAAFNEQQAQLAVNARPSLMSTVMSKLRGS
jgi:hypothetical protein